MNLGTQLVTMQGEHVSPAEYDINLTQIEWFNKPVGVIWSSHWMGEPHGSAWVQWCLERQFQVNPFHCYLLEPKAGIRLLVIDSLEDLRIAYDRYPRTDGIIGREGMPLLDFVAIAKDYDAVHLTERGMHRTHLSFPLSLYGWDMESTCWFRKFWTVTDLGEKSFDMISE